jgi:hypothetical protein
MHGITTEKLSFDSCTIGAGEFCEIEKLSGVDGYDTIWFIYPPGMNFACEFNPDLVILLP